MKFSGTKSYISTEDLTIAVNASITLERPLLVKGEPVVVMAMMHIYMTMALQPPPGNVIIVQKIDTYTMLVMVIYYQLKEAKWLDRVMIGPKAETN